MSLLKGKKVLLGVTGSIAAYKSAFVVRELVKAGADVQVICTPSALQFVTTLTLGTLSKHPVLDALVKDKDSGVWTNHVELGLWADLFLIAPASANTIAKMAHGEADNLLLTTYLSARCLVYFAPAMDHDMHEHPANQLNIETLINRGNIHIPSESGELASGLEGKGRMAEPEHIIDFLESHLAAALPLREMKVMVTAGPTYEPIDPVRFIGNHSSGKMGFALAERAFALGAHVTLITGPTHLKAPAGVNVVHVNTAAEMLSAAERVFHESNIAIFSAAVADYRPAKVATQKLKKEEQVSVVALEKTVDILHTLGHAKDKQLVVGFALETEHEEENARKKLERKNADLMVLNSLRDAGAGFGDDTNKVTLLTRNKTVPLKLMSKAETAAGVLDFIIDEFL